MSTPSLTYTYEKGKYSLFNRTENYFNMNEFLLDNVNYPKEIEDLLKNSKINNQNCSRIKISGAIICKNEEKTIERCIKSIANKVDEIIVLDTGSSDKTIETIKNMKINKVKLFRTVWDNSFARARNRAISKTSCEWIFFIDADEYLVDDDIDLHKILQFFDNFISIDRTIFSPKIIDSNGHCSISVGRIFKKNINLVYYGDVHEELRIKNKKGYVMPINISLNIPLMHDGYTNEVMITKDKLNRNLELIKKMLVQEPKNLRWLFFYLRDGENVLDMKKVKKRVEHALLICPEKGFLIDNIVESPYAYPILSVYISKLLCRESDIEIIYDLIDILEQLNSKNSDSIFYRSILKINQLRNEEKILLNDLMNYRKNNFEPQYGAIHSEGKNIDLLIGYFLFRLGYVNNAKKYFDYVQDIGDDNIIIMEYKNIINSVLSLYCNNE